MVKNGKDGQNGVGVPTGGTTGQVLKKKSDTNFDTEWANGGSGGVLMLDSEDEQPTTADDGTLTYIKSSVSEHTPTVFELEKLYNQIFINPIPQKIRDPNWSGDFIIKTDKAG